MKMGLKLLGVISFLYLTPVAAEGFDSYIGVQYGQAEAESENLDYGLARIGVQTTDETTIEFRTGVGTNNTKFDGVTVKIERIAGIYGSYHYDLSDSTFIYGIAGWSYITLKGSLGDSSGQEDYSGVSYGVGIESHGFNLEWMQYLDTSDLDASAVAIGYNYWFR